MIADLFHNSNKNFLKSNKCFLACGKMAPPGGCGRIFQCKDSVDILSTILYATACVGGRLSSRMVTSHHPR